ncbi:helicase HerA-like domain-containing protein [Gilvimarinus polysaccharolyticus]|uniref:helicase HerA-like domain-containing protein n=1 Tax=Gilvimarinus polysaccharolyticus TaxID=863921 RepID=UPI00067383CA|nr:helicase HerA-like domain-containing protein [Gilvimarinus polysaccharolyticus]
MASSLVVGGANGRNVCLLPALANRHGLIAGATGTGKTVSMQVLAEGFANIGVPVFVADIKGDLSGLAQPGKPHKKVDERLAAMTIADFSFAENPVRFWDINAQKGIPVRLALSDLGPQFLARLLDLNDTQESILSIIFDYADEQGLLLIDLNDLKTSLSFIQENSADVQKVYGRISSASIAAIRRRLILLEQEGLESFFGEPSLEFSDLIATHNNRGIINVLDARSLMNTPKTYAIFLLWLMSELFENLPEVGDPEKPVMVLFFDEAHLLFKDCPKVFVDKIEQVVRLIRSKGVGIYFISQSPSDIPDSVLGQLGNRIQHALRAYTPKEKKAVRIAAQSFRPNPELDTEQLISELGVGEALVSTLQEGGIPSMVERTMMAPPRSQIGPISEAARATIIKTDALFSRYKNAVDPESAHEILQKRQQALAKQEEKSSAKPKASRKRSSSRQGVGEAFLKSIVRSLGSGVGRKLVRGLLGSLLK